MNCVSPPELDDRQLLTYADGEADRNVATHLEQCPYCLGKARQLARLQKRLTRRLYRLTCPSPAELGEYHLGLLDSAQSATIAQHLQECPHCTREVAQLKSYLSELAPTVEFSPLERVKVLIARRVNGAWGGKGSEGTALAPAFAGIRGGQNGPYIYQVDDAQIAIEVQDDVEQPDRKVLLGLVTGIDTHGLTVHLWQAEQRITTASVDEAGNFVIAHLTPGVYELILSGPEVEIHIQALEV